MSRNFKTKFLKGSRTIPSWQFQHNIERNWDMAPRDNEYPQSNCDPERSRLLSHSVDLLNHFRRSFLTTTIGFQWRSLGRILRRQSPTKRWVWDLSVFSEFFSKAPSRCRLSTSSRAPRPVGLLHVKLKIIIGMILHTHKPRPRYIIHTTSLRF